MNSLALKIQHVELADYKGIDEMGKSSLFEYLQRGVDAYRQFFWPKAGSIYCIYPARARHLYFAVLLVMALLAAAAIVQTWRRDRVKGLWAALLFCLFPLAVNFIIVMAGLGEVHSLMLYAHAMPFILFAWMLDGLHLRSETVTLSLKTLGLLVLLFANVIFCRFDNECYLKAVFSQQEAISYFTTLITQIKSTEGYSDELAVSFVNAGKIQDKSLRAMEQLSGIAATGYGDANAYVNDYNWVRFMNYWCGYYPDIIGSADIENSPEVKAMPSYPDYGSIRVLKDRVVVKF